MIVPVAAVWLSLPCAAAHGTRSTETYQRIKTRIDAIPAIDTHDHLPPPNLLPSVTTKAGRVVNLHALWRSSYLFWHNTLSPWQASDGFDSWWRRARDEFKDVRATSFYRYQLPAFEDLYGIDFDRITDPQARKLNDQIAANHKDQRWLYRVITEKANIELMLIDPTSERLQFKQSYPWHVKVFNVTLLVNGFHESEFYGDIDASPYLFAKKHGLPLDSLDDYLKLLERLFTEARDQGAVCIKSVLAYGRTLKFEKVSKETAEKTFGSKRAALSDKQVQDFQDFIFWRLCALSERYDLPFQIHTGQGRIQSSSPMNLVDVIEAHPKTKFILFHGGFPWVGETGAIVQKHSEHVWVDSVWLPMLSYSTAKRAFHEWLEMFPSNRILWGSDCYHAEGVYGATEFYRRCLCEVLAEKVISGDLSEEHALAIGRQIMRDNALELFPQLKSRLWKHKGIKIEPPAAAK